MPASNHKVILESKIKEIARNARTTVQRERTPWFHRGEVIQVLAKALRNKAETVVLDGRAFVIKYDGDKAHVTPADGAFVPCAHFNVPVYLQEWEMYERATHVTRLSDQKPSG